MPNSDDSRKSPWLKELIGLPRAERVPLAWSFLCFFSILCAYFLLRPIRDEMAIQIGSENIHTLFLRTFIVVLITVPVFGWVTKVLPRRVFMPAVFCFFILNLLMFFVAMGRRDLDELAVARAFFVWVSVFNMFIVALFWSFMNDLYDKNQARRLFGYIAAGGSAGAVCGPAITAFLVVDLGLRDLIIVAACLLTLALVSVLRLFGWAQRNRQDNDPINSGTPIGGSIFEGFTLLVRNRYLLGVGAVMMVGTVVGTTLYVYQAKILGSYIADSAERTQLLASMDLAINLLTLFFQAFVARLAIARLGVGAVLMIMPILTFLGFVALLVAPSAGLLIVLQVMRRATGFGLNKPAYETLYSVVSPHAKYKAKNFIDVTVVRGSDVISTQATRLITSIGASFGPIAIICMLLCAGWTALVHTLGKRYSERLRSSDDEI